LHGAEVRRAAVGCDEARKYHERFTMRSMPRVLIVDELAESREVLSVLLARRGTTTIEARRPDEAARLAELHDVDLIVLDADSDRSAAGVATARLEAAASLRGTPIVILGTLRQGSPGTDRDQIVAKPYHYGPLVRKIEGLLAAA
jgi:CheY-like chemotaxis protein